MNRLNDVTPEQWDKVRQSYVKAIDENILEEEADWIRGVYDDMVAKPPHYNQGGIEAIDYIRQQLGEGFVEYCEGNVMKYLHRWRYKNGVEDLKKAEWYLAKMIDKLVEVSDD